MSLRPGDTRWPPLRATPGGDRCLRLAQVAPSRGMLAAPCAGQQHGGRSRVPWASPRGVLGQDAAVVPELTVLPSTSLGAVETPVRG